MHKFIPACHLENVDALNTAEQKKRKKKRNANQNELLKLGCVKTGRKKMDKWAVVSHDSLRINSASERPSRFNRWRKKKSPLFVNG